MDLTTRPVGTDPLLRHAASWGLPGGPTTPINVVGSIDIDAFAAAAHMHRVTGPVLTALDAGAVAGPVDELRDAVAEQHLPLLNQTLMAEADLVVLARALGEAGLEFRVLKGLSTAHLDYDDPAERMTSDVDLLVRSDQLDTATEALSALVDIEGSVPDRRAAFVTRFGKDRTLKLRSGGWLDLHRMIVPAYWGLSIDHDRFFSEAVTYELAGTRLSALGTEHRYVHAVLHAGATDEVKMQSFRDIAVLSAELGERSVGALNEPWLAPVRGLLAAGCMRLSTVLDVELPSDDWAAAVRPRLRERLALATRSLDGSRDHWSGPLAVPPWRWPAYLLPMLNPSDEYRAWYGRSRLDHLRSSTRARIDRRRS